jgi:hypothetical protein
MAAPSDAVVIGIILTLVFSAAIYYIYTLLQQLEGKVNVLNTVIFELKKTNEQYINMYEGPTGGVYDGPMDPFSVEATHNTVPQETAKQVAAAVVHDVVDELPVFSNAETKNSPLLPVKEESYAMEEVVVDESTSASANAPSSISLSANYESMTYKELVAEAKRKHVKGASKMTKQELIDTLKHHDNGTEPAGITTFDHFQPIAEEEFTTNFEDVINLN